MFTEKILVLGIGNILWADEGFGVRAAEKLYKEYHIPDNVKVLDGGTQGLYLLHYVQTAKRIIIFDAIDYGLPAGTMKVLYDDDVPAFMGAKKMSLHQTGFQDVLATAKITGKYPEKLTLIGVQPALLDDFGGSLTETVKAQVEPAVEFAIKELDKWDAQLFPRMYPLVVGLEDQALEMLNYETGRPSQEEAFRGGDSRFISSDKDKR